MNRNIVSNCKVDPESLRKTAEMVVQKLQKAGYTAFFAGGCVRDLLLGQLPNDYDIATNALPDEVIKLFPDSSFVGKKFGVVRVRMSSEDGERIELEVATFRKEGCYRDGRHPVSVEFSDAETDAKRRDFTINAMFFDPVSGKLYDYVGGREDLKLKLVRCVGEPNERFAEDHLRMLRAVRFASTLGFEIENATAMAIKQNAEKIRCISAERINEELTRILLESPLPGNAIRKMDELGLLEEILPEITSMKNMKQPPQFHPEGDVFAHTVAILNVMGRALRDEQMPIKMWDEKDKIILAYAVLLHDVGKPPVARNDGDRVRYDGHANVGAELAREILTRLRFSNREIEAISYCVQNHMRFMDVQRMRLSKLRSMVSKPTFPVELELHRLDCLASHGDLSNFEFLVNFMKELSAKPALPEPWITGHDIMNLGIPEGPQIRIWKARAYEAQLEERFRTREELQEWLRKEIESNRKSQQNH